MAVTTNARPMMGVLHVNGGPYSKSERYGLGTTSYVDAIAIFKKLCQWRAALLADDFRIVWARVSFMDPKHDAKAAIDAPLKSISYPEDGDETKGFGKVNRTNDSLVFRYETEDGQWADRAIFGTPDVKIVDDELIGDLTIPETPPVDVPALGTLTFLDFLGNFVSYVRNNCRIITVKTKRPIMYNVATMDRVIFRKTGVRKTARPFGV